MNGVYLMVFFSNFFFKIISNIFILLNEYLNKVKAYVFISYTWAKIETNVKIWIFKWFHS
jgi:hypothetical protein